MHPKSCGMVIGAVAFTLVILAYGPKAFAGDYPPASELPTLSAQDQGSAGNGIRAVVETSKTERERLNSQSEALGDDPSEQSAAKANTATETPDEVQGLKSRIIELQNKGKIGLRKIVLCRSVEGFGSYSPLAPGEPVSKIVFYCEPANVSTMISEGRFIVDCSVDTLLMDSAGKLLLGKENVVKINRVSRSPVIDLFFKIELNLKKMATRKVIVKIVLHDKIKNQSVSVTRRISVEGRAKEMLDKI